MKLSSAFNLIGYGAIDYFRIALYVVKNSRIPPSHVLMSGKLALSSSRPFSFRAIVEIDGYLPGE